MKDYIITGVILSVIGIVLYVMREPIRFIDLVILAYLIFGEGKGK